MPLALHTWGGGAREGFTTAPIAIHPILKMRRLTRREMKPHHWLRLSPDSTLQFLPPCCFFPLHHKGWQRWSMTLWGACPYPEGAQLGLPMPGRHWGWGTGMETSGLRKLLSNLVADGDMQDPSPRSPQDPLNTSWAILLWGVPHRRLIQSPLKWAAGNISPVSSHAHNRAADLANKNTGCLVKFESHINNEQVLKMISEILHGTYLYWKLICCLPKTQILHCIQLY